MSSTGVLFVCFGNICRSPMAEAVLRRRLADRGIDARFRVESRGTTAIHAGKPVDPRALATLRAAGYDLPEHRARQIDDEDFAAFHWIVAMDPSNLHTLRGWLPTGFDGQLRLFTQFAARSHGQGIADPYNGGDAAFVEALAGIEAAMPGLLASLDPLSPDSAPVPRPD
jgi:protein-tyrosine phosphatase